MSQWKEFNVKLNSKFLDQNLCHNPFKKSGDAYDKDINWEQTVFFEPNMNKIIPCFWNLRISTFLAHWKSLNIDKCLHMCFSLIAIGLEQFKLVSPKLKTELIHKHLVPVHATDKILKRVKQMQLTRAPENPIKVNKMIVFCIVGC